MQSWIFSIITSVFSVTWSSEIIIIWWFAAQETFLIIIIFESSCGNHDKNFEDSLVNKKGTALFKMELFCNIINVFTANFDQFNAA